MYMAETAKYQCHQLAPTPEASQRATRGWYLSSFLASFYEHQPFTTWAMDSIAFDSCRIQNGSWFAGYQSARSYFVGRACSLNSIGENVVTNGSILVHGDRVVSIVFDEHNIPTCMWVSIINEQ